MAKAIGFVGFLIVFGAVGGMDNATDAQLAPLALMAFVGIGLMTVSLVEGATQ